MEAPGTAGITAMIAQRMKALRTDARLSGPALAGEMKKRGIPWNRTTVAKLETGKRESVSAQELLVLAVVLNVPLVWLLVDPQSDTPVPIAEGVELSPWDALLWMIGDKPLSEPTGKEWDNASELLSALQWLTARLSAYDVQRGVWAATPDDSVGWPGREDAERMTLAHIAERLEIFRDRNVPPPPLPAHVVKRTAELGVQLPGHEVEDRT